jgi:hypothetical protein
MTHSVQPTSSTSQGFQSYEPPWQGYDLHQGGYGGSQMFPTAQFEGHGPSSTDPLRVPSGPLGNHPVNWPTSSSSTPPPQLPFGPPGRQPVSLPTNRFQLPREPCKADGAGSAELPPHCRGCLTTNMILLISSTILQNSVVPNGHPESV